MLARRRRPVPGHDDLEPPVRPPGRRADERARLRGGRDRQPRVRLGAPTRSQRRVREMRLRALGANMVERKTGQAAALGARGHRASRAAACGSACSACAIAARRRVTLAANVAHLRFDDDSTTASRRVPAARRRDRRGDRASAHIPAETDSSRHAQRRPRAARARWPRRGRLVRRPQPQPGDRSRGRRAGDDRGLARRRRSAVCDLVVDPVTRTGASSRRTRAGRHVSPTRSRPTRAMVGARSRAGTPASRRSPADAARRSCARRGPRPAAASRRSAISSPTRCAPAAQADIAMQNSGGLRADLPAGPITRGAIYEVMPFDNTIIVLDLSAHRREPRPRAVARVRPRSPR